MDPNECPVLQVFEPIQQGSPAINLEQHSRLATVVADHEAHRSKGIFYCGRDMRFCHVTSPFPTCWIMAHYQRSDKQDTD
jgi:hypothetical protein